MSLIANNLNGIKDELMNSKSRIIAVSKYVSSKEMAEAYEAGVRDFGENKVKDALDKKDELPEDMVKNTCWHFIGHLQSNKAKKVVGNFDYIHSVDSLKLAQVINDLANKKGLTQKVLIQVNVSGEESKFGIPEEDIFEVFASIIKLDSISVEGLMMMAPYCDDEDYLRSLFSKMRNLQKELQNKFKLPVKELSMGMSNDYKIASQEGSTMVRIGTKIFK